MGTVTVLQSPRSVSELDRLIGQRIRQRRHDLGYSQSALAEAIGVTFQQVQKYEGGVNRVSAVTLLAIAGALELEVMDLLVGPKKPKQQAGSLGEILKAAAKLNQRGRTRLAALASELAKDKQYSDR